MLYISTFHWTAFPLRSWRSRSFSKIIPNRSRSVDSQTIWRLHASSTRPLRFYYALVTLLPRCSRFGCVVIALLLRSRYDNEDPATLSLRYWRCSYALATTSATELRFRCTFLSFLYYTPIPLDGVSAMFRNFGQNDTKRGRNAKKAAETPRAQSKRIGNFMIATSLRKF